MHDSFVKQPSYRDDAMTGKSRDGLKHKRTSNDFENRNFGAFVSDLLFAKKQSMQEDEDEYSSPVLGKKQSSKLENN